MLYDSIYMRNLKQSKPYRRKVDYGFSGAVETGNGELFNGDRFGFEMSSGEGLHSSVTILDTTELYI